MTLKDNYFPLSTNLKQGKGGVQSILPKAKDIIGRVNTYEQQYQQRNLEVTQNVSPSLQQTSMLQRRLKAPETEPGDTSGSSSNQRNSLAMTQQYTAKALGQSHFATKKPSNADCFLIESSVDKDSLSDTRNPSDLRIGLTAIKNNAESSKNVHNSAKTSIKNFDLKTYQVSQELQPILRNFAGAAKLSGSVQNQNEYESKEATDDSRQKRRNRSIGFQQHNSAVAKRN